MSCRDWIEEGLEEKLRKEARADVLSCLEAAEAKKKHGVKHLFTDVYAELPKHLGECSQAQLLWCH